MFPKNNELQTQHFAYAKDVDSFRTPKFWNKDFKLVS